MERDLTELQDERRSGGVLSSTDEPPFDRDIEKAKLELDRNQRGSDPHRVEISNGRHTSIQAQPFAKTGNEGAHGRLGANRAPRCQIATGGHRADESAKTPTVPTEWILRAGERRQRVGGFAGSDRNASPNRLIARVQAEVETAGETANNCGMCG